MERDEVGQDRRVVSVRGRAGKGAGREGWEVSCEGTTLLIITRQAGVPHLRFIKLVPAATCKQWLRLKCLSVLGARKRLIPHALHDTDLCSQVFI